jgi:hypothetical protein
MKQLLSVLTLSILAAVIMTGCGESTDKKASTTEVTVKTDGTQQPAEPATESHEANH